MKVFHLHVGNKITKNPALGESHYLRRISFDDGMEHWYFKQDIINADSQMNAVASIPGISLNYGHLSDRKSIKNLIRAGIRLRSMCKREKYDLVHVFWGSTTALMAVIFAPCPVVISYSGSDLIGNVNEDGRMNLSGRTSRFLSQIAALLSTKIVVKSEHMRSILWSISRRKSVAIPNGLDLKRFMPLEQNQCKARLGWQPDNKIIIFFNSGGAPVKNERLAKAVFELVRQQRPEAELKVLHGIPHEQLIYYYNAADVMLLTSFHEGSNNSLKEARACNLPIVSTEVGDASERLRHVKNSYVVASRSAQNLANSVLKVLANCERSDGAGKSEEVSLESIAQQIVKVYKSITNGNDS
jgi:glycosyltransferase involved in cell wall biosynthesis